MSGRIKGELLTPTGAALAAAFADEFGTADAMIVKKIGYGCGKKDFEAANVVRAMLGEQAEIKKTETASDKKAEHENGSRGAAPQIEANDGIREFVCNIDDMTAEEIGFAMDELFAAGALDVYTTPIGMKKNRPGIMLTCMCRAADSDRMLTKMFRLTTTLGIREYTCRRFRMERGEAGEWEALGVRVRRKDSTGYGAVRSKLEYDDCAEIARIKGISLREARALVESEGIRVQ